MASFDKIIKRAAMGMTGLTIAVGGPALSGGQWRAPRPEAVIVAALLWSGLEFYVGWSRSFEGKTPSHLLIRLSRMAWPLAVVYSWLDFRFGWTRVRLPAGLFTALMLVFVLGLGIRAWAILTLGRSFSYDVKRPQTGRLVSSGPYRWVRHPSYLGVCILGSLSGLLLGSLAGFAGLALATIPQTAYRAKAEDRLLRSEFGEEFEKYARKTGLILPFIH